MKYYVWFGCYILSLVGWWCYGVWWSVDLITYKLSAIVSMFIGCFFMIVLYVDNCSLENKQMEI